MLSVGRREDDVRVRGLGSGWSGGGGGGGGVVMEEENELEEGEAYSLQDDDDDDDEEEEEEEACIDPDSLSYIDKKLESVLGHFQKDFEGGVSAENLGAKFGGYGSFLPTYQRSPSILSQPKSPQRVPSQNVERSPYCASFEGSFHNPEVTMKSSVDKNKNISTHPLDNPGKRDMHMTTNNRELNSQKNSFNKPINGTEHKTLKVRIKVGPDSSLIRNNAAIYSGLGLDISSSPSIEESPDESGGNFRELQNLPDESPMTILQVMTCFSVPGGHLISPLRDDLFQLTGKKKSLLKGSKKDMFCEEIFMKEGNLGEFNLPVGEVNGQIGKKTKSGGKKARSKEPKNPRVQGDTDSILNKETGIETPVGQGSILDIPLLSCSRNDDEKSERQMMDNVTKTATMILDDSKERNKVSGKYRFVSSAQASDKQLQLTENFINNRVEHLGNKVTHPRKLNNKQISSDSMSEEQNAIDNIDLPYRSQRDGRTKGESASDKCNDKTHPNGYKERNEQTVELYDNFKQISLQKAGSHVFGAEMLQGQALNSDRKRKVKAGRGNSKSLRDLSKDSSSGNSYAAVKERKKSDATTSNVEKKVKVLKPRKESGCIDFSESHGGIIGDAITQPLESGNGLLDSHFKMKDKIVKSEGDKELIQPAQILKGKSGSKKVNKPSTHGASVDEEAPAPLTSHAPPTEATMAPHSAVVIEENWVSCDKCLKWRLLPYGTNTAFLPTKWQCSLLNWLPGMNSCDFSEEETTKALHALYMVPAPEIAASHQDVAASGFTSTTGMHPSREVALNNQTVPIIGRKKAKGVSNMENHSAMPQSSNSAKKNQYALETSSSNKLGDFNKGKQKQKQNDKHNVACYSDGGETYSKSKGKRVAGLDENRASKKLKQENMQNAINDGIPKHDLVVKVSEESTNGMPNNVLSNHQPKYINFDLADSTCDKPSSSGSSKKSKVEHFGASDGKKSGSISLSIKKRKVKEWQESHYNQEAPVAARNAGEHMVIEGFPSQNESMEERKAKLARSGGEVFKASKLDSRMGKKGNFRRAVLPASGEHLSDAMDDRDRHLLGKENELSNPKRNAGSCMGVDFHPLKKESAFAQTLYAANSSSSKISGSCRSKNNHPETKGSPVESVSSSPLRILGIEKPHKMASVQMDDSVKVGSSFPGMHDYQENYPSQLSGGKYEKKLHVKRVAHDLPSEIIETNLALSSDGLLDQRNKPLYEYPNKNDYQEFDKVSNKHHNVNGCIHRKSGKGYSGPKGKQRGPVPDTTKVKVKVSRSNGENKDSQPVKIESSSRQEGDIASHEHSIFPEATRIGNFNFQEKQIEKDCLGKNDSALRQSADRLDNRLHAGLNEKLKTGHYSSIPDQLEDLDSRVPRVGARCGKSNMQELQMTPSCQRDKVQNHAYPDSSTHQEPLSGAGRSQLNLPSGSKKETQCQSPVLVSSPLKERTSKSCALDVLNDPSKVVKQLKQQDTPNGPCNNNQRQATPNGFDTSSPARKDGHPSVSAVLKEARDLKHTANRLKAEGLESESTGLYFEAALKFLYAASLMEPLSSDNTKHGDAALMYWETAKLCQYVAHEYEKHKEMAGAALAYKCVEVAYLKAAYCRNASASKDRHELHAALQMLPPGESPSSSASDIDNLNNQATLGKAVTAKGLSSPQVAGNHVIAARLHPQVLRLLHYTNDLNCAFEATRKSQIAIAAASGSLENEISSVKKVLDFNFHNVEGLMRLVRLAMESIGR